MIKYLLVTFIGISVYTQAQEIGTFKDSRDGITYQTVKIGTQVWFAENLNFKTKGSWCYNDSSINCESYGRLYFSLESAKIACPVGWHIPTKEEFEILVNFLGGAYKAGSMLKKGGGSGFNALVTEHPMEKYDQTFVGMGIYGHFWTSTIQPLFDSPYQLTLFSNMSIIQFKLALSTKNVRNFTGYSVRCIKD
jgi:uncharacterized protein (TIGR02145 family)